MTKLKFLLLFLFFTAGYARAQWEIQLDVEGFTFLDRICFIDSLNGWAIGGTTIGSGGPYFYTTDGGENWYLDDDWWDVAGGDIVFVNRDTGFIATQHGKIYKTTDNGQTWDTIHTPATQDVIHLFFVDENNGWATLGSYSEGKILHTIDDSDNWELQSFIESVNANIESLFFINEDEGWGGGDYSTGGIDYSVIKYTNDKGENWIEKYISTTQYYWFQDIFFTDTLQGWVVGQKSSINTYLLLHTEDGGETWTEQTLAENSYGSPTRANCVFFVNDTVGWVGTGEPWFPGNGSIYLTTDGGENWNLQQEFYDYGIFDIQMLNQDTGWAVGGNYVYHTTNGDTITITGVNENRISDGLFTISPNPSLGIFTVHEQNINQKGFHNIVITNTNSQTVYQLSNQTTEQLKNFTIDISSCPSGIYFITISPATRELNNRIHSLTKKIIKL